MRAPGWGQAPPRRTVSLFRDQVGGVQPSQLAACDTLDIRPLNPDVAQGSVGQFVELIYGCELVQSAAYGSQDARKDRDCPVILCCYLVKRGHGGGTFHKFLMTVLGNIAMLLLLLVQTSSFHLI
jgi:hypothetical protein